MVEYMNFWEAGSEDLAKGYIYSKEKEGYICLICQKEYDKGVIYPFEDQLFEAKRAIKEHINKEHGDLFEYYLHLDRKFTGLTDVQIKLLQLFYAEKSDKEIGEIMGISPSTVRNQRFKLKEKEKQAKMFLALMMQLERKRNKKEEEFIPIHRGETMVDERYAITEEERRKVLSTYFKDGLDGKLSQFPSKEKRKIIILSYLITKFAKGKSYTESEVNELLKKFYEDYATLRRYLIEYGFLDRNRDGSLYWVKIQ